MIHVLLALVISSSLCTSSVSVSAAPLQPRQNAGSGSNDSRSPTSIQPQIWIPLVIIASLFVVGTLVACTGRRLRRGALAQAAGAAAGTTDGAAREVTADQLAGTNADANATANANGAGTNRARRPRRTRRTPSQISTHSLPAYMKEPGEQEIVIVRGADDTDEDIPITITMPPLDEAGGETPYGSVDLTTYPPSPNPRPSTNVPLLHESDALHLSPDGPTLNTRASFDSAISSAEDSSQHHYLDEAPAYETVILDDIHYPSTSPASPPTSAVAPANQGRASTEQQPGFGTTRRRSMFASIFNSRSSRGASSATAPPQATSPEPRSSSGHAREGSGPSVMSVEREPRRSRVIRHQPSHSGSGSMFSLLSRTRSNQNMNGVEGLTSPSLISLHSISSPLSHTLVKTEFTYPRGGPTPDQLKLISSRESFARFGRPYGQDAIAFAASTSRANLEPPPDFEEVAGPSGAGSPSPPEGRDSPSSGSGSHGEDNSVDGTQVDTSSSAAYGQSADEARATHILSGIEESESPAAVEPPSGLPPPGLSEAPLSSSNAAVAPTEEASPTTSPTQVPGLEAAASGSASPESQDDRSPLTSGVDVPTQPQAPLLGLASGTNAPPSAFKSFASSPIGGSFPARAASRASSYMSYATAEESLHSPTTPTPGDSQYDLAREDDAFESAVETPVGTAPPTPRISPRHVNEGTDTTIMPGR